MTVINKIITKEMLDIDGFTCDGCGATISFKDRKKQNSWAGIHHGFLEQNGGYKPLDACSVKCYAKVLEKFIKDNPECKEIEISNMGIGFAKSLILKGDK